MEPCLPHSTGRGFQVCRCPAVPCTVTDCAWGNAAAGLCVERTARMRRRPGDLLQLQLLLLLLPLPLLLLLLLPLLLLLLLPLLLLLLLPLLLLLLLLLLPPFRRSGRSAQLLRVELGGAPSVQPGGGAAVAQAAS